MSPSNNKPKPKPRKGPNKARKVNKNFKPKEKNKNLQKGTNTGIKILKVKAKPKKNQVNLINDRVSSNLKIKRTTLKMLNPKRKQKQTLSKTRNLKQIQYKIRS